MGFKNRYKRFIYSATLGFVSIFIYLSLFDIPELNLYASRVLHDKNLIRSLSKSEKNCID